MKIFLAGNTPDRERGKSFSFKKIIKKKTYFLLLFNFR